MAVPSAQAAAERLCAMAADARAAVVLDAAGELAGSSGAPDEQGPKLAELTSDLLEAVDGAAGGGPPAELEAQVEGGAVFLVRRPRWTIAVVARRSALSSLMLYDLRAALDGLEPEGRA
jgi:hypothetical protein